MPYTMSDVAKLANVSPATVSRVLSKSSSISAATTKRVLSAIQVLHYHPNVHARRLAVGKSDLFGLVISEIANPYFAEIIRGFQAAAWERGFDVLLLNTEYKEQRTDSVVRKMIESDVRGVSIMTSSLDERIIRSLTREGISVVLSNVARNDPLVSSIRIDYEPGIAKAIDHVVSLGHRHAAVIAGPVTNPTAKIIREVLTAGLKERGLTSNPVTHSEYHLEAAASAVNELLAARTQPTVIFCGSDLIAMGAMVALEAAGLEVPLDISVVGIDDIAFAYLARPPLTTIRVPREELGLLSFEALERSVNLKRKRSMKYVLETELIVRRSTAPPPTTARVSGASSSKHKTKATRA